MSVSKDKEIKPEILEKLAQGYDEHLVEGRKYIVERVKSEHGSSGSGFYFIENGEKIDFAYIHQHDRSDLEDHLELIDDLSFDGIEVTDLIGAFVPGSKVRFTLEKGQPIKVEKYDIKMFLDCIEEEIRDDRRFKDAEGKIKYEGLINFFDQDGELGISVSISKHFNGEIESYSHVGFRDEVKGIHTQLEGKIESLYLCFEDNQLTCASNPAFPTYSLNENTVKEIVLNPEFKKRKDAGDKAEEMRSAFYEGLGILSDDIFYYRPGGFRTPDWPKDSLGMNDKSLRIIYTPKTTILITDGLSDVYRNEDQDSDLKYNGIGIEFYLEFEGKIETQTLKDHFCTSLMASVTDIAAQHGKLADLYKKNEHLSIEFNEANVELWSVNGNDEGCNIYSFFRDDQFEEDDRFGAFLGIPSENVPPEMELNLEKVFLINIKPFGAKWFESGLLSSSSDAKSKKAREEIIQNFNNIGEGNVIPLTYKDEYLGEKYDPRRIIQSELIPTRNLK